MESPFTKLYTADEAIKILRLDCRGTNPYNTLAYLIRTGRLKASKIAGRNLFTEDAIQGFIDQSTEKGIDR